MKLGEIRDDISRMLFYESDDIEIRDDTWYELKCFFKHAHGKSVLDARVLIEKGKPEPQPAQDPQA